MASSTWEPSKFEVLAKNGPEFYDPSVDAGAEMGDGAESQWPHCISPRHAHRCNVVYRSWFSGKVMVY